MERPLCPLCKTKHFASEPHVFKDICAEPVVRTVPKASGETPLDQPLIPVAPKNAGVDRLERRPGFDRTAYQRDYMRSYMRKYRARTNIS